MSELRAEGWAEVSWVLREGKPHCGWREQHGRHWWGDKEGLTGQCGCRAVSRGARGETKTERGGEGKWALRRSWEIVSFYPERCGKILKAICILETFFSGDMVGSQSTGGPGGVEWSPSMGQVRGGESMGKSTGGWDGAKWERLLGDYIWKVRENTARTALRFLASMRDRILEPLTKIRNLGRETSFLAFFSFLF